MGEQGGGKKKPLQSWWSQEVLTQSFLMEGTKAGTGDVRTNSGAVPGFVTAFIFAVKRGKCLAGKKGNHIKLQREGSYRSCVPIGCFVS